MKVSWSGHPIPSTLQFSKPVWSPRQFGTIFGLFIRTTCSWQPGSCWGLNEQKGRGTCTSYWSFEFIVWHDFFVKVSTTDNDCSQAFPIFLMLDQLVRQICKRFIWLCLKAFVIWIINTAEWNAYRIAWDFKKFIFGFYVRYQLLHRNVFCKSNENSTMFRFVTSGRTVCSEQFVFSAKKLLVLIFWYQPCFCETNDSKIFQQHGTSER